MNRAKTVLINLESAMLLDSSEWLIAKSCKCITAIANNRPRNFSQSLTAVAKWALVYPAEANPEVPLLGAQFEPSFDLVMKNNINKQIKRN